MRITALVSLALALVASSMPLPIEGGAPGEVISAGKSGVAQVSQLNGKVEPAVAGTQTTSNIITHGLGSRALAGGVSDTGAVVGAVDKATGIAAGKASGAGSVLSSRPGSSGGSAVHVVGADRRSATSSIPGDVTGQVSQLGGKVKSAAADTQSAPNVITHGLGSRAISDGTSSAGGIVGTVNQVSGAAVGKASDAGKVVSRQEGLTLPIGGVKGVASSAEQAAGNHASGTGVSI